MRIFVTIILLALLAFAGWVLWTEKQHLAESTINEPAEENTETEPEVPSEDLLTDEAAELTAFHFVQDFIAISDEEGDGATAARILNSLSRDAKEKISPTSLYSDLLVFMKVGEAPELGASVEDLQVGDEEAVLTVGLNYESERLLRNIHLIAEEGRWKVDQVSEQSDI